MSPDFSPFMHFAITIIIFSRVSFANGKTDEYYKVCSSPSSCGSIKDIRYPFWGDDRPKYCGLADFKLDCGNKNGDFPHTWVIGPSRGSYYKVHSIDTSNSMVIIARDKNDSICQALRDQDDKPPPMTNKNGSSLSPFRLGEGVVNLSLYYDCPGEVSNLNLGSFLCASIYANVSVYYLDKQTEFRYCNSTITFPVSSRALDEFVGNRSRRTLESVLEEEFEVKYSIPNFTDCLACQNSSGVCGSSLNPPFGFVCYRPGESRHLGLFLGLGIAVLAIIAIVHLCYYKKLKSDRSKLILRSVSLESTTSDLERGSLYFGVPLFSYKDLQDATNNFDQSRLLGEGGFGRVYYGKLKDGREVAVKQLFEKSYKRVEQFMNEVQILTCLRHQNLVALYGCTSPRSRELLLVYEYISNGTVADHLYGETAGSAYLSWTTRFRIAIETANALAYLHASDIIHRDVKTNNILLDGNFGVKVADFGLSRLFPLDVTHVSTAPQGTPGYLDPEYHQCYQLTIKSDVYSFGVVLVELISSLPAVDMSRQRHEINLSNYAMNRIQRCAFEELIDPRLGYGSDIRVRRMTTSVAELAFQCLQHDKEFRPSIDEVLEMLKGIESADYSKAVLKISNDNPGSSTREEEEEEEENDGARLLMGKRNKHAQQQILKPRSPISVMDKWGSRSSVTDTCVVSNTSKQGSSNVFYEINSNSFDNSLFDAKKSEDHSLK